MVHIILFVQLIILAMSASAHEIFIQPMSAKHVYQYSLRKLGWAGIIYCGPAAVTESLAFLKWHRTPNFPLLKWPGVEAGDPEPDVGVDDLYAQTLEMVKRLKTTPWLFPFFDPHYTDSVNIVEGLRTYFKDSGYPHPWVFARGFRAHDAAEERSLDDMQKPVTLAEIREYSKKGYGVVLLIGYYNKWGQRKRRNGGHFLSVFGYRDNPKWGETRGEFFVTDSTWPESKQPRTIFLTPIEKNSWRSYPSHVNFKVDDEDTVYLDAAIFFIPQA